MIVSAVGKPYTHVDNNGQSSGVIHDLETAIFKHMAVSASFSSANYTRASQLIKQQKADISSVIIAPNEKLSLPGIIYITLQPIRRWPIPAYSLHSRGITINSAADLSQHQIGIVRVEKEMLGKRKNYRFYSRNEYLFRALAEGEIDLALATPHLDFGWSDKFKVEVKQTYPAGYVEALMAFFHVTLGDKAKALCEQYYRAYQQLSQSGELSLIINEAGLSDMKTYFIAGNSLNDPQCQLRENPN